MGTRAQSRYLLPKAHGRAGRLLVGRLKVYRRKISHFLHCRGAGSGETTGALLNEVQELVPRARAGEEHPRECRGGGDGIVFLDTAELHAGVLRFDYHRHAERMQRILDAVPDLLGKALLHLQPSGIRFHNPCDFAQPGDSAGRDIRDVALAYERQQVVLAGGVKVDVLNEDHLAVFFVENRLLHYLLAVFAVALREILQRLGHPFGRLEKAFAVNVFPQQAEHFLNMHRYLSGNLRIVDFIFHICHSSAKIAIFLGFLCPRRGGSITPGGHSPFPRQSVSILPPNRAPSTPPPEAFRTQ